MTDLDIEKIHAEIVNLNAETAKLHAENTKMLKEAKYESFKVVAYVVATFTAAFFLAFKVTGAI